MNRFAALGVACTLVFSSVSFADAPERLAGLQESATVSVDAEGIAHVRANNEHDLYFMQGWVHARERLFQMDYNRRVASGTVAELVGQAGLPSDVQLRTLGLRRAAERSYAAASMRTREALQAYAEGVNAWASSHALPIEYGALQLTAFQPWHPVDSLSIGKLISFSLSFELDTGRTLAFLKYQGTGAVAGFDGSKLYFEDLWRSAGFERDATVPDAGEAAAPSPSSGTRMRQDGTEASEASIKLMKEHLERVKGIPAFRGILSREARGSSNLWAVSGALTQDGRPLIANDPHLQLSVPSVFFPMGLELADEPVFGSTFAGTPGVVHGYNRYIAWGSTNNLVDVTDVFSEKVEFDAASPSGLSSVYRGAREWLIPIPQVFRVNRLSGTPNDIAPVPPSASVPAATLVMPRRDGGPIINLDLASGAALSVQYVGFAPTQEAEAILLINRARNLAEFKDALQRFDVGSQNFVYGDIEGNIAYFTTGEVPVREDLQAGGPAGGVPPWFIRSGQGGHEWLGVQNRQPHQAASYEILPFAELPQIVNPPAGYFVNGNNDPAGLTRDNNPLNQVRPGGGLFYLAYSWNRGFRAARINARLRELLQSGGRRISFEEMQAVQADVILRDAEVLKPYIVAAFDNAAASSVPALRALADDAAVAQAVARLRPWDGSTPTGSVAASIYAAWRSRMIKRVIDDRLALFALPSPDDQDSLAALRHLLDNFAEKGGVGGSGIDFFAAPGVAAAADRRDIVILASLEAGLDMLAGLFGGSTNQDSYVWGGLHKVALDHPLGAPFSIPPIPTDGGFQTVDAASHSARASTAAGFIYRDGSTHRSVFELDRDGNRGASIWPGGTSGDPRSPNYSQFLQRWVANQTVPLLLGKQEVKRAGAALEHYVP